MLCLQYDLIVDKASDITENLFFLNWGLPWHRSPETNQWYPCKAAHLMRCIHLIKYKIFTVSIIIHNNIIIITNKNTPLSDYSVFFSSSYIKIFLWINITIHLNLNFKTLFYRREISYLMNFLTTFVYYKLLRGTWIVSNGNFWSCFSVVLKIRRQSNWEKYVFCTAIVSNLFV